METDLFQSCGHCWVFQICWHIECSTFTALSFRIWNSWTGIPSPPLALFIVMLSKAHLTSHSRMSGSRWVITPSWLSGLWKFFLYSSSVYSYHLFLISSASVRSTPFLSFIEPIFASCLLTVSQIEHLILSPRVVQIHLWTRCFCCLVLGKNVVNSFFLFSGVSLHGWLRPLASISTVKTRLTGTQHNSW